MAELFQPLDAFPGFGVLYDPTKNPYFRLIMVENLKRLQSVAVGKSLLSAIQNAKPASRKDFPLGINVICKPTAMMFTERGMNVIKTHQADGTITMDGMKISPNPAHSPAGCPFWKAGGGSANEAVDQTTADNGSGTVCVMFFTNVEIMTSKGEKTDPYIVLAHELIHSLHCLEGTRAKTDEELWTTGIDKYASNPMSENAFRSAFGMPLRTKY